MNPQLAELPVLGYPSESFFGASGLSPEIASGMAADSQAIKPVNKVHVLVVVGAFVAVGYLLFHLNER